MAISAVNSTFNTPAAEQVGSRTDALDRLDFLQMLMAQMQNQDPMSPMESQEYAAQLAQFSSVQELTSIKQALDESINMNLLMTQSINSNLAAALVGKTVRAQNNTVEIADNSGADLRFSLGSAATTIQVDVRDESGEIVRTLSVSPHEAGDTAAYWDGRDSNGNRVPNGNYTFEVSAQNADGGDVAATTYVEGIVTAVNYADGGVTLTVNGQELSLGDIVSVMSGESSDSSEDNSATYNG
jgi:flagellar basal-body rod modification protein FlgD